MTELKLFFFFEARYSKFIVNFTVWVLRVYAFCSVLIQHLFMALKVGVARYGRVTSIRLEWLTIALEKIAAELNIWVSNHIGRLVAGVSKFRHFLAKKCIH